MRVLFISNTANFSKFNLPFMKWFHEQGWIVDYVSKGEEAVKECDNQYKIDIARTPFSFSNLKALRQVKKIVYANNYDLIHCHTPMGGVLARLAAIKLWKNKKVKIIYTAHGFHFYKGAPLINWLLYYPIEKFFAHITDILVTINTEDYERAKIKFGKITDVRFINGVGVDLNRFNKVSASENNAIRKFLGFKKDDFIIVIVAELNKNKNQSMLIKQIPNLKKNIPDLKVLFLGKETLPLARNLVIKLCLEDVCHFMGYRHDVDLFEKMADLCFSASIREGLPINVIESMACGKPCVCSVNRGHRSLIKDGENGYLFNLNNPKEMCEKILDVYSNKECAKKMSENAYIASKKYSKEIAVKTMERIYNDVLKNARGGYKSIVQKKLLTQHSSGRLRNAYSSYNYKYRTWRCTESLYRFV